MVQSVARCNAGHERNIAWHAVESILVIGLGLVIMIRVRPISLTWDAVVRFCLDDGGPRQRPGLFEVAGTDPLEHGYPKLLCRTQRFGGRAGFIHGRKGA